MSNFVRWARPVSEMALAFAALTAALAPWLGSSHVTIVSLLYLLVTLVLASRWGYPVGIGAAVCANVIVNFFFVAPLYKLTVATGENVAALTVFLGVAAVGAFMLSRLRQQAEQAKASQAETEVLLRVTRDVADAPTPRAALDRLCAEFAHVSGARGCALLAGQPPAVAAATIDDASNRAPDRDETAVAVEALHRAEPMKLGKSAERRFEATLVPVEAGERAVLRLIGPVDPGVLQGALFAALANELRTTMRRAALALDAARARELELSGQFKSLLLTSASHDLRSPLTAIKAAVSSLRDDTVDWTDEDRREFLRTVEAQTDRLTKTVTNLLEMQRLETGVDKPRAELVEVAPLFAEVALVAERTTKDRPVTQCAPPGLWLKADYGLLVEALGNLVENAAKYGEPGTPIRLEASSAPGRVFLAVSNSGKPISEKDLPHVFDRFYRGSGTGGQPGGGLGLALVKTIAEGAGGSVSVTSDKTATVFTISLPMAVAPQ